MESCMRWMVVLFMNLVIRYQHRLYVVSLFHSIESCFVYLDMSCLLLMCGVVDERLQTAIEVLIKCRASFTSTRHYMESWVLDVYLQSRQWAMWYVIQCAQITAVPYDAIYAKCRRLCEASLQSNVNIPYSWSTHIPTQFHEDAILHKSFLTIILLFEWTKILAHPVQAG